MKKHILLLRENPEGGRKMVTLKCDVRTCTYNKENCCCKGDISVGGKSACDCSQTCCDSFKEAKGDQYLSALEHPSK